MVVADFLAHLGHESPPPRIFTRSDLQVMRAPLRISTTRLSGLQVMRAPLRISTRSDLQVMRAPLLVSPRDLIYRS
ncbi:hypothetical protein RRG08_027827 [Elysia crispata]|uniref:Uncharacterized protein n=1 Tax=Elysia crispata TaxID=231223 RepID=A0AAE1EE65_9GAST|nr:hypothetical protein RRG08_027827 [Elysia crispata]